MGGATWSMSKVVILSRSILPDCDVDYLFGAVSVKVGFVYRRTTH
jgi:2-methylaconitate cis-trans-isomerase PrpF